MLIRGSQKIRLPIIETVIKVNRHIVIQVPFTSGTRVQYDFL
jgi:hypothetical protein